MHRKDMKQLFISDNKILPKAYISRMDKPSLKVPVALQDARVMSNQSRKHHLAVCLQPIFLLADWTLLVQFFEIWIAQGVTKFCVYVQSMTPEVDALLHVYEHSKDVEIERINWAPLPADDSATYENDDPNLRIYRTEVATSINDCLLRSRGYAKYVISSDLDEIVVNYKESSLLNLLDNLQTKFKKSAAFIIRSSFALFETGSANVLEGSNNSVMDDVSSRFLIRCQNGPLMVVYMAKTEEATLVKLFEESQIVAASAKQDVKRCRILLRERRGQHRRQKVVHGRGNLKPTASVRYRMWMLFSLSKFAMALEHHAQIDCEESWCKNATLFHSTDC
uniref:Glycosyltransferase family 92 protein n=1 Tax=Loa loa TaxID=7209 RepID=A0A1I7V9J1_LOALO